MKLQYKTLGKRYGKSIKALEAYFAADVPETAALAEGRTVRLETVRHNGAPIELTPEDVIIESVEAPDKAVAEDGDVLVGLNLEITEELRCEGIAREFVRLVQNLRRSEGLEILDTIDVFYNAPAEISTAVSACETYIRRETLADSIQAGNTGETAAALQIGPEPIQIAIRRRIPKV